MIKVIISQDPFYFCKNRADTFIWSSTQKENLLTSIFNKMETDSSIIIPYAEKIFDNESIAIPFLQKLEQTKCDITFICHEPIFSDLIQRHSIITKEESRLEQFTSSLKVENFSEYALSNITENLSGFPYSTVESIVSEIKEMNEQNASNYVIEQKKNLLKTNRTLEVIDVQGDIAAIGGLEELKHWIISRKENFGSRAREFGIPLPKGVLMLGVQGCGKSLTAKIIANIWKFPLLRLDFINLFEQNRSVEELMKETIELAEKFSPLVLWIDEIEKALSQTESSSEIRRVLGWLMTWMQEKKSSVFLVATANKVQMLPPELLRKGRFDEIFFVDLPSKNERIEIFDIHLQKRGRSAKDYNINKLAELAHNFSGAEIEQSIIDALTEDFTKGRELSQTTMEETIRHTVPLSVTYDEEIKALRLWSKDRAKNASGTKKIEDMFFRK